ncbi:sensor histidine kinase [Microbacterium keratanolyticum]|uniref:sensor histidine kinase n=1 Tax=Microbacterium keratanolyticum TaxID=67574 RepID=UPI00362A447C
MSAVQIHPDTATAPRRVRHGYARAWRDAPGTTLYLMIVALPVALTGLVATITLFLVGVGSIVLVIGLPLIAVALYVARGFAISDRALLRMTGLPTFAEPEWRREPRAATFFARVLQPMRNGHYWSALVHAVLVRPITALIGFAIAAPWVVLSTGGPTYWFWGRFLPESEDESRLIWVPWVYSRLGMDIDVTRDLHLWTSLIYLVVGVIFALTLPLVLRGLAHLQRGTAVAMLGRWASDDLGAQVAELDASRGAALQAEDTALRRLERDIHDGPQQRLVRLQMDLAAIERRAAAGDAEAVARLAAESRVHARSALDELRALAGGMAPPLLQDRGLVPALEALAQTSPVPVTTQIDPTLTDRATPEVARNLYFVVAELLTNVAKHSGATSVALSAVEEQGEVHVTVQDDGRGGARIEDGHGLQGIAQRVQGMRGAMSIASPEGGTTSVALRIPLTEASVRSSVET